MSIQKLNTISRSIIQKVNGVSTIYKINNGNWVNIPGYTWSQHNIGVGEPDYAGVAYGYNTTLSKHIFCIVSTSLTTNRSIYSSYDSTLSAIGAGPPSFSYRTTPLNTTNWSGIVFGNNLFVAYSSTGGSGSNGVMTSPDGITWTARTTPTGLGITSMTYGNGRFVGVTNNSGNITVYSTDGITWTPTGTTPLIAPGTDIHFANGYFQGTGGVSSSTIYLSTDGITWTTFNIGISASLWGMHYYINEYLFITTQSIIIVHSTNLSSTTTSNIPFNGYRKMRSVNNCVVAIRTSGTMGTGQTNIIASVDGTTWHYKNNNYGTLRDITSSASSFLAVGTNFLIFSNN